MLLAWWIQTCATNSKGKRHLVWGATHPLPLLFLIFPPYLEEGFLFFFFFIFWQQRLQCIQNDCKILCLFGLCFQQCHGLHWCGTIRASFWIHKEQALFVYVAALQLWEFCMLLKITWLVASLFKCRFLFSVIISVFCHILFKFHFTTVLQDTLSARNKGKYLFSLIWGNHCTAAGSKHWKKHTVFK